MAKIRDENIKILGKNFRKRTYVNKEGMFRIPLPEFVSEALDEWYEVCGKNYEECNKEFNDIIRKYKLATTKSDFDEVILFSTEGIFEYGAGDGVGIAIYWGVYKKIKEEYSGYIHKVEDRYFFVRGMGTHMAYMKDHIRKGSLVEVPYSQEAEETFVRLEKAVRDTKSKIEELTDRSTLSNFIKKNTQRKL